MFTLKSTPSKLQAVLLFVLLLFVFNYTIYVTVKINYANSNCSYFQAATITFRSTPSKLQDLIAVLLLFVLP